MMVFLVPAVLSHGREIHESMLCKSGNFFARGFSGLEQGVLTSMSA